MTPQFIRLEQAITKKSRHNKRHARSAGIKEIRKAFAEYKEWLEKPWLDRFIERWGLK